MVVLEFVSDGSANTLQVLLLGCKQSNAHTVVSLLNNPPHLNPVGWGWPERETALEPVDAIPPSAQVLGSLNRVGLSL